MLSQKYSYVLVHDVQRETNNLVSMPLPPPKSGMAQMPPCVLFEMGKKAEEMLPKILNGI